MHIHRHATKFFMTDCDSYDEASKRTIRVEVSFKMDLHDALMVRSGQVATGGGESMSGGMEGAAGVGGRGKGEALGSRGRTAGNGVLHA